MKHYPDFNHRLTDCLDQLGPAAQRTARFFSDHREEVLITSASGIAAKTGTSDATVIRTAKALGFSGMAELRHSLATELKGNQSPVTRLAGTLGEVGDDLEAAFEITLDRHLQSLENLRHDISRAQFRQTIQHISDARRVLIFGIGPSSAMATYFEIQLGRFGIDAISLTQSGLLLADGLLKIKKGDLLILMAYSRVYDEVVALLKQATHEGATKILITDTLGIKLRHKVDLVLGVDRGNTDNLSMHTATLGLIEILLVGLATARPEETLTSLRRLNRSRVELAGKRVQLPGRGNKHTTENGNR